MHARQNLRAGSSSRLRCVQVDVRLTNQSAQPLPTMLEPKVEECYLMQALP
jgi:hypothetical protein